MHFLLRPPLLVVCLWSTSSAAVTLSLSEVAARARAQAAGVQAALLDEADAEAERDGVVFVDDNPAVTAMAGPRSDALVPDGQLTLSVPFSFGVTRGRALAAVDADVARARAVVVGAERAAVRAALAAALRAHFTHERLALARDRAALAGRLRDVASARRDAGDLSRFDAALVDAEVARADAAVFVAEAFVVDADAVVSDVVGEDVVVAGSFVVADVVAAAGDAIDNDVDVSAAAVDAAAAAAGAAEEGLWPDLSLQTQYNFDDGAHIGLIGVGFTLPVFDNDASARAHAAVAVRRAEHARALSIARRAREQRRAVNVYDRARAALWRLDEEAVVVADNAGLADAAWSAGKIDLPALLLVRRAALETRDEHLSRQLGLALAALDVVAVGLTPASSVPAAAALSMPATSVPPSAVGATP